MRCVGWIPIITTDVFHSKPIWKRNNDHDFKPEMFNLEDYDFNDNKEYSLKFNVKCISDQDNTEKSLFIYQLNSSNKNYPKRIFLFSEIDRTFSHIITVNIEKFDDKGLICLKSDEINPKFNEREKFILTQIFIDLRDLYHDHLFQFYEEIEDASDFHNEPYFKEPPNDEKIFNKEAIEGILKMYEEKMMSFLRTNNENLSAAKKDSNRLESALLFRRQAKGSILYSLNFVSLYEEHIEDKEQYIASFNNGLAIMDTFSEQINTLYSLELIKLLKKLSTDYNNK